MSVKSFKFILTSVILCLSLMVSGQSKRDLENKRDKLSKKIKLTTTLISKTEKSLKAKQSELFLIDKQISFREELIQTLQQEIAQINEQMVLKQTEIETLEAEVKKLKEEYAQILRHTYKTRNVYSKLMFVFASADFNQALSRLNYLNQYSNYRKEQASKINEAKAKINVELALLKQKKDEKEVLYSTQKQEKSNLSQDKSKQVSYVNELKSEGKKLKSELKKQEREQAKINRQIERIITEELSKNRTKSTSGKFSLTPEAKELSNNFSNNKGKLPWPVERGIVTSNFGKQAHPTVRGVMIDNNGITISTDKEADVRAVFRGEVSNILVIPGAGKVVVINHGAYRSVYTNLKDVSVSKGQTVVTKQSIGKCLKADSGEKSEAHLEIWQIKESGIEKLNPKYWLLPR